ncbi:MAG: hypothetical protein GY757_23745 [bacterium]|nr:hypothetical protein [bacterium]
MKEKWLQLSMVILLVFCLFQPLSSWSWKKIVKKDRATFAEIRAAVEKHWNGKKSIHSGGWKQYKRWEWFARARLDKNGYFAPQLILKGWQETKARFASADMKAAADWTFMGPATIPANINSNGYGKGGMGRINGMAFDPLNSNIIWVGAPSGGLWKSTDGGGSWSTNTDNLPNIGVTDIVIHPRNPNIMYIATGDGDGAVPLSSGVLKSTDRGETWQSTGLDYPEGSIFVINKLLMHPADPETLLVASYEGIYKTTDGGANWELKTTGYCKDIEVDPQTPSTWYTAKYRVGVSKSDDSGENWSPLANGLPTSGFTRIALALSHTSPNILYALYVAEESRGLYGLYRSADSGATWTLQLTSPNILGNAITGDSYYSQGTYDLVLEVSPTNPAILYVGGINLWKSVDSGVTWNYTSNGKSDTDTYVHVDHHDFAFLPGNSSTLFSCNDGGIFKSTNAGATWTDLSSGLAIHQSYRLGLSASERDTLILGNQDNGTDLLKHQWQTVFGADGMECMIHPTNPGQMYFSTQYGNLYRTASNVYGIKYISGNMGDNKDIWTMPFLMDLKDPDVLYTATSIVSRSPDRGDSWTAISPALTSTPLTTLKLAPSDSNSLYASNGTRLFRTINGGDSWSELNNANLLPYISDIAIHPDNPEIVWITMGNYRAFTVAEKVYRSDNGGNSWTNISGSLPNLPVNCAVIDHYSHGLYIGTDVGVFYSPTGRGDWKSFHNGFPNVIVNELEIHQAYGEIFAATYGRGVWKSPLAETPAIYTPGPLYASLRLNKSLFQMQYVDLLEWKQNSMNSDGRVDYYRVYEINGADKTLLGTVEAGTLSYGNRHADTQVHQYAVTAVNNQGKESPAVFVSINPLED